MKRRKHPAQRVIMVAVAAVALGAVAMAVLSTVEALEERRVAAAANDLRFAAVTVSAADAAAATGRRPPTDGLAESVDRLNRNRDQALHALHPNERAQTELLLDEIAG